MVVFLVAVAVAFQKIVTASLPSSCLQERKRKKR